MQIERMTSPSITQRSYNTKKETTTVVNFNTSLTIVVTACGYYVVLYTCLLPHLCAMISPQEAVWGFHF